MGKFSVTVDAKDLAGHQWASPATFPEMSVPPIRVTGREKPIGPFSPEFFWFVGAWLGDGWTDLHQRPHRLSGQAMGKTLIGVGFEDAEEFAAYLDKTGMHFHQSRERTTVRFVVSSRPLARWLREQFGQYSYGKHLPSWVFGMNQEWRQALFAGPMDC